MKKTLHFLSFLILISTSSFGQFDFSDKMKIDDTANNPQVLITGDINNDDLDDILVATRAPSNTIEVYLNNGGTTLSFTKSLVANTLTDVFGAAFADINEDGFLDIIATGASNGTVAWYPNNQLGGFDTENVIISSLTGPTGIVTGDINNDNNVDIILGEFGLGRTLWFANDGSGSFSSPNIVASLSDSGPFDLDVADFDNDGDLDVVVGYFSLGSVELYDNNLISNSSVSFTKYTNSVAIGYTSVYDVKFADANNDEELDILVSDFGTTTPAVNGKLGLFIKDNNSIDTSFSETILTDAGSQNRITNSVTADFDDDGINDIIYTNAGGAGDVRGRIGNSTGGFEPIVLIDNSQTSAFGLATGDFDNDGVIDFVTTDDNPDDLNIFINDNLLGIDDYTIKGIEIYPNPTSNKLNFRGMENFENHIAVFNNLGQKIIESVIDINSQIDVSNLASGIYFLRFKDVDGTFKFIKN